MDCAKLIAFGVCHPDDWWDFVNGKKEPYGLKRLSLILMPTYPSSGSEYGLGAVSVDFHTASVIGDKNPVSYDAGVSVIRNVLKAARRLKEHPHEEDISAYFKNIFGYEGCVAESAEKMIALFEEMGIDIHFEGDVDEERTRQISIDSMLKQEKITQIYIIGE